VSIEIRGVVDSPDTRAHVTERLSARLARLGIPEAGARVSFVDENGPKGGVSITCTITMLRPRQPALRIEHVGETPRLAFDGAFRRFERRLEQDLERRLDSRRHPKKYFLASQLLAAR
jgi:ribosome-associated translation inhibitor RaiA